MYLWAFAAHVACHALKIMTTIPVVAIALPPLQCCTGNKCKWSIVGVCVHV